MRRAFKWLVMALLGTLLLLMLTIAAWVACNGRWADASPQPLPPELASQPVTLAPQDNAFFGGQGLRAPEGESANVWGQRSWRGEQGSDVNASLVPVPSGDAWQCDATKVDCVQRWRASAAALAAQMKVASTFGERCKALAARTAYQEPAPQRRKRAEGSKSYEALPLPQFAPLSACVRWLQVEAVLAPDAQQAGVAWGQADALIRVVAGGAQTLIGQAVAWSWVTRQQQMLAQWTAQQAADYTLPAAWLAPLPANLLQPRVWIAMEWQFQREAVVDLGEHGEQMFSTEPNALQAWAGRHSLGYLPELTMQAMTAHWLEDMRAYGQLQGAALARQVRGRAQAEEALSWWDYLRWRNTVGHILVAVARPQYEQYALRQADLVLYQSALQISQSLNRLPAAQRAAWWASQSVEPGVRERLTLEGDALLVRTWRGEVEEAYRAPVRFPLRPA